jgi:hypothetical protein
VTAADADMPAQPVTFSIVGGDDAAKFDITPGGALAFQTPPDFDAPSDVGADNVYVVTVQARDVAGKSTQQTIHVTVTPAAVYPLPGDFNDDAFVDASDLPVWRSHFGQLSGADSTDGDADGDQDVDGADFLSWQRNLGHTSAPPAIAAAAASESAAVEAVAAPVLRPNEWILADAAASSQNWTRTTATAAIDAAFADFPSRRRAFAMRFLVR